MPLEISSLSPLHTLTFFASGWMFCASPSFASSAEQFRDTVAVPGGSDEPVREGHGYGPPKIHRAKLGSRISHGTIGTSVD
jgi:hypothetical protein